MTITPQHRDISQPHPARSPRMGLPGRGFVFGLLLLALTGCQRPPSPQINAGPVSPMPSAPLPSVPASPATAPPTPLPSAPTVSTSTPPASSIPPGEPGGPDPLKTAPEKVTATPDDGQIALDWNSSGAESYSVYRSDAPNQEGKTPVKTGVNSTPWRDQGLTNGRTYYYQVTGMVGGKESPRSAEVAAMPQAAPPPPKTHLTQAAALARAQEFCRAVGVPAAPGQAQYPARPLSARREDTYWQPRWDARIGNTQLEVVDATGIVTKFFAFGTFDQRPAGHAIPRSQALARAAAVVRATGLTETLGLPQAQEAQITSPPTRDAHLWNIVYPRQSAGHEVRQQQVTVILQAETGALQGLGVTFPTPPPSPAVPRITVAAAQTAATVQFKRAKMSGFTFRRAFLEWVQPNGAFQPGGNPEPTGPLRLVWGCQFTQGRGSFAEVWVDAQTGKLWGGELASLG